MMFFVASERPLKKAKSKEAFRAVDLEAPLLLAKISKEQGAQKYLFWFHR